MGVPKNAEISKGGEKYISPRSPVTSKKERGRVRGEKDCDERQTTPEKLNTLSRAKEERVNRNL